MSVVDLFDGALKRLAQRRLHPISIVADPADHAELAALGAWPVTFSPLHLSFRGVPTFKGESANAASIVGRTANGITTRIPFRELAN